MSKFGRFEFGKEKPTEMYVGDSMELDKSYVRILRGNRDLINVRMAEIVALIHLDKGQSVRQLD